MELLSKNLDELMKSNNPKKLSLKSVLMAADQMVKLKIIKKKKNKKNKTIFKKI